MARSRVQSIRSNVSGARPASQEPGTIYTNWPDRQIGVADAGRQPIDLVGVRFFSATASYVTGDLVVQNGKIYRAAGVLSPGAFDPTEWQEITVASGSGIWIGDAPPGMAPVQGQLLWESDSGDLFVWYEDADSGQWVQINVVGPSDSAAGTVTVENFGARAVSEADLATLTGATALATANDIAVQAALDYAASIGGGYVNATGQIYVMGTAGLEIPEGVFLRGNGSGAWDTSFHTRAKTWKGTTFLFKGTGVKKKTITGITSCDMAGGVRGSVKLHSFMNANATGVTPATPKAFSAAISGKTPRGRDWGLIDCRVVPWLGADGIAGYSNQATTSLGDDWDVGILVEDGEYVELLGVQSVGYWRMYGCVFAEVDWSVGGAQERNRIGNCKFQGHCGLSIRAGDQTKVMVATANTIEIMWSAESPWAATGTFMGLPDAGYTSYTYTGTVRNGANLRFTGVTPDCSALTTLRSPKRGTGAAGTCFTDTITAGLDHVSDVKAEVLGLGPSSALEISGFPVRGLQFINFRVQTIETVREWFHNCEDTLFVNCQLEGPGYRIASPYVLSSTAPAPMGDTRNLRFISTLGHGADETYWTPRSYFSDMDQISYDEVSTDFDIQPWGVQDINVYTKATKSFFVRRSSGSASLRVTDSGNVSIENSGQLSLLGGTGYINLDASQAFALRHGTTTRWKMYGTGNWSPGADDSYNLGSTSERVTAVYAKQFRAGDGSVMWTSGSGSPEGVVAAAVGSLYTNTAGGASTTLYVKQSGGTTNTGWVAK